MVGEAFKKRAADALEGFRQFFGQNSGFIGTFFFINYFTMAWSLLNANLVDAMVGYGVLLFLASAGFAWALRFLRKPRLIQWVKALLLGICAVPFFLESFVMYSYQALLGVGIINSLLETNIHEAKEYLTMYVGMQEIALFALAVAAFAAFFRLRPLSRIHFSLRAQRRMVAGLFLLAAYYAVRIPMVYPTLFVDNFLPIQRVYASAQSAVDNMHAYHELTAQINRDVRLTRNEGSIKNIVFILGESTNRNHMHLYGYYLPTTPKLDKMSETGEICVYRDVISPHSTTIAVLSKLFTFCDYESEKPWYEYNNLIDIMNAAGYRTHWLSNQESSGIWGNVAQVYADHSTMHKYTRIRDSREDEGILDEALFPLIDEARQGSVGDKNFYVVHLMGGHALYYNRFPYRFFRFKGDDIALDVPEDKKLIVAQYDDAIYYNDYVVTSIIDKFRDAETLVIYLPDHGEAVYDENCFAGHIEENPNRHMIEIPLIFWASEEFKAKYPEKWAKIQSAADRPYMTDDMIHTVLDLADIETADFAPSRSIVNETFDASRPRIFNEMNYDTQIKTGNLPEDERW